MGTCNWIRGPTIGWGSSAAVSVATAGKELLAVKSAEFSRSQPLQREQRILARLNCSRVVGYLGFDVTTEKGTPFFNLLMEYVPGGTLSDAIKQRGGRLEEPEIRSVTKAVLQGLSYLHSKHLVHCDIKGRNILMAPDGPKIADLGCAKWVDESGESSGQPIAGTPLYMAPEVARGEEQGFAADIWAVGCTVIEMATGRAPWPDAEDPVSVLYRIAHSSDVPEFPSCLSSQATDFLNGCLRRNPAERWSADELLRHPFVNESNEFWSCLIPKNSPTSVLGLDFWDSIDESETELRKTHMALPVAQSSGDRLRRLSGGDAPPMLDWGEDWITVRIHEEPEFSPGEAELDWVRSGEGTTGSESICSSEAELEFSPFSVAPNEDDPSADQTIDEKDGSTFEDSKCRNSILGCTILWKTALLLLIHEYKISNFELSQHLIAVGFSILISNCEFSYGFLFKETSDSVRNSHFPPET